MHRRISLFIFLFVFLFSIYLIASSAGKTARTSLSSTPGCTCHGASASTNVTVTIDGPDSIEAGATASYQVKISGGPANSAGINIAASDGSLVPVSSTLQAASGELTHVSPVSFSGNTEVTFDFELTAPSASGEMTLAAVGNSVNLNGSSSGDEWNFAPDKVITVVTPNSIADQLKRVPDNFTLNQNYPNPFNPQTTISYTISANQAVNNPVELSVYNAIGQKIKTLVNTVQSAGTYNVTFDAGSLPSGSYFYSLRVADKLETRKMILSK